MSHASRVLRLLAKLATLKRGLTVNDIAAMFGTSTKQARRDLIDIRTAGFFLTYQVEEYNAKRYWVDLTQGVDLRRGKRKGNKPT
jgi:predicted DNA-binding transcriptional regulator YafY